MKLKLPNKKQYCHLVQERNFDSKSRSKQKQLMTHHHCNLALCPDVRRRNKLLDLMTPQKVQNENNKNWIFNYKIHCTTK